MVKNPPANTADASLISGSGRSPGGRHGNPLQYSCLENPMGRGIWQATFCRVTQSWIQLRWLSTRLDSEFLLLQYLWLSKYFQFFSHPWNPWQLKLPLPKQLMVSSETSQTPKDASTLTSRSLLQLTPLWSWWLSAIWTATSFTNHCSNSSLFCCF